MKKTILITGCSSGIGLACALALKDTYHVIASCRNVNDLIPLKEKGIDSLVMDMSNINSIKTAFLQVLLLCEGHLDFVFNNAGYGQMGAVEDLTTEVLIKQFNTNVFGLHELTYLALKQMRKQGCGRVIQNSSVLGFVSMPYRGAYNASKHAVEALSDTLRLELRGSNIKIITLQPGPINTQFRQNSFLSFKKNICTKASEHQAQYKHQVARLQNEKAGALTMESDAVVKALIKAMEAKKPKAHYRITLPTTMSFILKKLLPTKWLDCILA
jgi:short-subunit dehydrogenase